MCPSMCTHSSSCESYSLVDVFCRVVEELGSDDSKGGAFDVKKRIREILRKKKTERRESKAGRRKVGRKPKRMEEMVMDDDEGEFQNSYVVSYHHWMVRLFNVNAVNILSFVLSHHSIDQRYLGQSDQDRLPRKSPQPISRTKSRKS
jgi:hypothetical protein